MAFSMVRGLPELKNLHRHLRRVRSHPTSECPIACQSSHVSVWWVFKDGANPQAEKYAIWILSHSEVFTIPHLSHLFLMTLCSKFDWHLPVMMWLQQILPLVGDSLLGIPSSSPFLWFCGPDWWISLGWNKTTLYYLPGEHNKLPKGECNWVMAGWINFGNGFSLDTL